MIMSNDQLNAVSYARGSSFRVGFQTRLDSDEKMPPNELSYTLTSIFWSTEYLRHYGYNSADNSRD